MPPHAAPGHPHVAPCPAAQGRPSFHNPIFGESLYELCRRATTRQIDQPDEILNQQVRRPAGAAGRGSHGDLHAARRRGRRDARPAGAAGRGSHGDLHAARRRGRRDAHMAAAWRQHGVPASVAAAEQQRLRVVAMRLLRRPQTAWPPNHASESRSFT
jgi:hypothetical protein